MLTVSFLLTASVLRWEKGDDELLMPDLLKKHKIRKTRLLRLCVCLQGSPDTVPLLVVYSVIFLENIFTAYCVYSIFLLSLFHLHTCISIKYNHSPLFFRFWYILESFRHLTYLTPSPLQTMPPPAERDIFSYFDHLFWQYFLFINDVFLGFGSMQSVSFCQGGVQNKVQFSRNRALKDTSLYSAQTKIMFIFV